MKILLLNYEYKPQCGGAGLATYNLAKELKSMGHDISLVIGWDYRFGNPEIIPGIKTYAVSLKKKGMLESSPKGILQFLIKGFFKVFQLSRKENYDIVQFFFSVPTGLLKYALKRKTPYICSLRGMDIPSENRKDKFSKMIRKLEFLNRRIVTGAAAITVLSSEQRQWFLDVYPNIQVNIIPNGVSFDGIEEKREYSNKVRKFILISRFIECKNIEMTMYAFQHVHTKYPDIVLDIFGDGYLKEHFQNIIETENMSEYIHLKGHLEQKKLYKLMPDYDAFILLTVGDSFGQVFTESMACGLPVICADQGGPADIVINMETGLKVQPNSLDESVNAIQYLVENPQKAEEFGKNGRMRAKQVYSMRKVAQSHVELYEKYSHRHRRQ